MRRSNQLHGLVAVPGLQVGHRVLQVLAELVLEEHLMKLLKLAQLQHGFKLRHARGRAVVWLLLRCGLGWLVASVGHGRCGAAAGVVKTLELVLGHEGVFEQLHLELVDFGAARHLVHHLVTVGTGEGKVRGLKLEAFDLASDIVEVLALGDPDIVLEKTLHHLLLLLCDRGGVSDVKHRLLQVSVEVRFELALLLAQGRVPVVLDGVVAAAQQDVGDLSPPVLHCLVQDVEDPVLLDRPVGFLQQGVQLVMPTLSALLARAALHLERHVFPLVRPDLRNHLQQLHVLHVIPCALARLDISTLRWLLRLPHRLLLLLLLLLLWLHHIDLYLKRYQLYRQSIDDDFGMKVFVVKCGGIRFLRDR